MYPCVIGGVRAAGGPFALVSVQLVTIASGRTGGVMLIDEKIEHKKNNHERTKLSSLICTCAELETSLLLKAVSTLSPLHFLLLLLSSSSPLPMHTDQIIRDRPQPATSDKSGVFRSEAPAHLQTPTWRWRIPSGWISRSSRGSR